MARKTGMGVVSLVNRFKLQVLNLKYWSSNFQTIINGLKSPFDIQFTNFHPHLFSDNFCSVNCLLLRNEISGNLITIIISRDESRRLRDV